MHQRHSAKSVPPALIDEGRRYFFYGGDDQLTQVVVSNAWMTDFQYDGQRRKRITRDYAWQNSTWIKTNEVRYVYDGMLVIQERDANNIPIKTYTRGLDLSGTFQGAGGIGGLLAMTDHKDITARHYYYHGDANGNVTALINEQQVVMARYAYDPFGNQISAVGPVSGLNPYRFSSKEWHPNSGLYYYGYRFYEPNLQRWINQDPIGVNGGINLYNAFRNNPLVFIDPLGLEHTWSEYWWAMTSGCKCVWDARNITPKVGARISSEWRGVIEDNDFANAVKHCTWMCAVASLISCSKTDAIALGNAHENYSGNPRQSKAMDLYNNRIGINLSAKGQSIEDCLKACKKKLSAYELYWFKGANRPEPYGYKYETTYPTFTINDTGFITGGDYGGQSTTPPIYK